MPLTDPRDMRRMIRAAISGQYRLDGQLVPPGQPSACVPLIRSGLLTSELDGYSGEDVMTILAYRALRMVEQLQDRMQRTYTGDELIVVRGSLNKAVTPP